MGNDVGTEAGVEPEQGRPGSAVCKAHGLHYDPELDVGCVLCRREPRPQVWIGRNSLLGTLVTLALAAAIVAGGFYASERSETTEVLTPAALASGSSSQHAGCYSGCAEGHQACSSRCDAAAPDGACDDHCFTEADRCFSECTARFLQPDPPWSYYYGTPNMPDWSAVLQASVGVRGRMLACSEQALSVLAFVAVRGADGSASNVAIWSRGIDDSVRACVERVIGETRFVPSEGGDYQFLARFDDRYDDARLLFAQAEAEVEALPRRRGRDAGEATKSRLFDVKVLLERQGDTGALPEEAELAAAKERLAALRAQLAALDRGANGAGGRGSVPRGTLFSYPAAAPRAHVRGEP